MESVCKLGAVTDGSPQKGDQVHVRCDLGHAGKWVWRQMTVVETPEPGETTYQALVFGWMGWRQRTWSRSV
jgi:hypothetical protein